MIGGSALVLESLRLLARLSEHLLRFIRIHSVLHEQFNHCLRTAHIV